MSRPFGHSSVKVAALSRKPLQVARRRARRHRPVAALDPRVLKDSLVLDPAAIYVVFTSRVWTNPSTLPGFPCCVVVQAFN